MISGSNDHGYGYHTLMRHRVENILLVASPYDCFILEQDGRLADQVFSQYISLNLTHHPRFNQVSSSEEALKQLQRRDHDVVIITAQVFGRPAPRIVSKDMVQSMQAGSVVVDMAVEAGGNVEGSILDEVVDIDGVKVVGQGNLPSQVARNASEMYSNNLFNLLHEFWDEESKSLNLDPQDEIVQNCVITHEGAVVNETIKNIYGGA